jgi:uncharacterized protein YqeY
VAELKEQLRSDLTAAMKARQQTRVQVLRMALTAITTEEVAGSSARQLSDTDVQRVLLREVRKRKEAAEAFDGAGRSDRADAERAEAEVLTGYLPAQMDDAELEQLVSQAYAEVADGESQGRRPRGGQPRGGRGEVQARRLNSTGEPASPHLSFGTEPVLTYRTIGVFLPMLPCGDWPTTVPFGLGELNGAIWTWYPALARICCARSCIRPET